jgi:hypothetical protein
MLRILFICAALALTPFVAVAKEKINAYDVDISVEKDGDILVTETIEVTAEGNQIRRGIFRDLPRFHVKDGARLPFRYDLISIKRNGQKEPFQTAREGNAVRWRIGDADVYLPRGRHVYEIAYEVKNQIRYFDTYDELYWNAVGQYWAFPIDEARIAVTTPDGATVTDVSAYTGRFGESGSAYAHQVDGARHVFRTTRALDRREGVTVSISFAKGAIDPPQPPTNAPTGGRSTAGSSCSFLRRFPFPDFTTQPGAGSA